MAGEIEEPFRLNFQADSLHSGSISFGRFESEFLCWERRSSFSHNRYLEDVEKCSTPGLVTEKKAYFEAHFRKKGLMRRSSPDSRNEIEYQTSDNGIPEKTGYDEASDHTDIENHSARFDESLNGYVNGREQEGTRCEREEVFEALNHEPQIRLSYDEFDDDDCFSITVKVEEVDRVKLGDSFNSVSGIEMKEDFDGEAVKFNTIHSSDKDTCLFPDTYAREENSATSPKLEQVSSHKGEVPSAAEHVKPRLMPRLHVPKSRGSISSKEFKASANKPRGKVNDVPMRSKVELKISEATAQNKSQMHRTTKYETGSKIKGVNGIKRSAGKEPRNRVSVDSRSSMLLKVSNSVHQSENRVKPAIGATKPGTKQDISRFRYNSVDHRPSRKEFDMNSEEKMHTKEAKMHQLHGRTEEKKAETKLRPSHNFKATPMSSYSRGPLHDSNRKKAIASIAKPQKLQTNSSNVRTRVSEGRDQAVSIRGPSKKTDQRQASGTIGSHSTMTLDSTASSPAAEISSHHLSQGGRKKEREKEKHTIISKSKVLEDNLFYKGKTMDEKLKTRTGARSTNVSFKNSSRTGHLAVGVVF